MLLATDLDGTFLAGDPESRLKLYQLISAHPDIQLAFVTGRGLESVIPLLSDPTIPEPDYIICDVGCTVVHGESRQAVQPIQGSIDALWPGAQTIEAALESIEGLQRQEVPQERRVSYFCERSAVTDELVAIGESLNCDVLFSAGKYLDFLPRGVNKGRTLIQLVEHLGIDPELVMVAGDTLNDLSMYQQGFKGVCVGESERELLEQTEHQARIYHAERPGCGGILEAFEHFGFLGHAGIEAEVPDNVKSGKSDLVMVYHRLPYEEVVENGELIRRRPKSPNGIIPTLLSFFAGGTSGAWVAWSIDDPEQGPFQTHTDVDTSRYEKLVAARVPLSKSDVDIFYKKFSKEAFWPTLHTFWERASFRDEHWQVFLKVNRLFAERAAQEAAENAVVWIHDYNLWMVPAYLRELRPDVTIAFFHHTYFPSADVFNVLPWRRDIIGSLLHCDYIGFHIPRQAENFVDVARGVTPLEITEKQSCAPRYLTYGCAVGLDEMSTEIKVNDRRIGLGAHPVGLDLNRVKSALANTDIQARMESLREELSGTRMVLSVERLDFTKGIIEKLDAYERMLNEHPELLGKVTLLMVCVPAAEGMTIYEELQSQIEQTVGRINGRFSRVGWTPLQFFFRSLPFEELVAYYAMADVMWITPLRDGLNLVAKEYVATQGLTDGSGVLVLSEFAGAAAELRGAILANPHHPQELADTCYYALAMSRSEARDRLSEAYEIVCRYDIALWGQEFVDAVTHRRDQRLQPVTALPGCAVA
ncbi:MULTISPECIES: glucosylglycerol-phosphate synthase [Spongiibacter]|uniref:glucosylglycerol-phosphate synthase n=1 Tax=Spongiibacter TaxID=630749 RepID=UPI001B2306AE|nr:MULTISPECIES: glucosylglycerol-phosphate synthase [Spongiibacter]MBO6752346.1 glucosylglycerol-phosphate synthase [Spongiibacter sp.]|tara:strand:+ start:16664 stop:18940 length:2277 start_codon:yes stop_codon:yes gene_type:complete